MNNRKVSVIVLTYNASWERVRATLNSVILQKGIDFELIVADDCSRDNHFDKIRDFLSRYSFTNYQLVSRPENFGTVKNFLEAAKLAQGEYIRGLGQGDMFFDEYALRDCYDDAVKNNSEVQTSKAVFFKALSNPVKVIKHQRYPQNIEAYNDHDTLRESYLIDDDRVSGATVMYMREILIDYFTKSLTGGGIKMLEDFIIKLMVFDKRKITFFNRNAVYYEFGAGISTQRKTDEALIRIRNICNADGDSIDDMLLERCEVEHSDFSQRLKALIFGRREKNKARQALKQKLGIFAIPLSIIKRTLRFLLKQLAKKIMTDTNVSTDFANLCINRE